ncbi:uncharacterized protein LOC132201428 [Neocloeon triangulifer]|uniref:uncharacterized protein LOC132201428 n=1 Tax=Neocloeon triangulifer TaxID=2078957 RepID=UPI00286F25F3|nr:uncharacterized protein LOC132201428 [Neocloeon triangulifer]
MRENGIAIEILHHRISTFPERPSSSRTAKAGGRVSVKIGALFHRAKPVRREKGSAKHEPAAMKISSVNVVGFWLCVFASGTCWAQKEQEKAPRFLGGLALASLLNRRTNGNLVNSGQTLRNRIRNSGLGILGGLAALIGGANLGTRVIGRRDVQSATTDSAILGQNLDAGNLFGTRKKKNGKRKNRTKPKDVEFVQAKEKNVYDEYADEQWAHDLNREEGVLKPDNKMRPQNEQLNDNRYFS